MVDKLPIKSITVEIDLTDLDVTFLDEAKITNLYIEYFNHKERSPWEVLATYKIIKVDREQPEPVTANEDDEYE